MRTPIHPDCPRLHIGADVDLVGDDFLRSRMFLFPDPKLKWPAVDVGKVIGLTLVLEQVDAPDIVGLGIAPGGIVDGYPGEIALDITGNPVSLIFVIAARPLSYDADLAICRSGDE